YTYLLDKVNENYQKFYGLKEVKLLPTVIINSYLQQGVKPGESLLYREVADDLLSELADHNFKWITIHSIWVSNGRIGSPYNGNRLATHEIEVYPDDIDRLKYFINKTNELDMKLMVWLSTCYSKESSIYKTCKWQVQNIDGSYPTAHSGDVYLMSYRSGYLSYALKKLKDIKEDFEFSGLWHDSFTAGFNIDYSDKCIRSPIDSQIQFLSATQKMGYSPYTESLGPFGVTAVGSVAVTPIGSPRGDRDINAAFEGREYLAYKTSFTLWHPKDYNPLQIDYYKFLANKAVPMIAYALLNNTEREMVSQANKDYITVLPYMDKRHVLSDERGVLWYDEETETQVLFAYKEFSYNIEGNISNVFDITNNTAMQIKSGDLNVEPRHTYILR
ncbi:MAG: hypothetical protein DRN12_06695, partial [Thermoplasmata archaeon]